MARIHGPDGILSSPPAKTDDNTQWTPFTDPTQIEAVRGALRILRDNVTRIPACDQYFQGLRGGRSFTEVLEDQFVWISFDPTGPAAAETVGKHITLGKTTVAMGRWTIASTLVHELAHVNGASDGDGQAEKALLHCGLKAHFIASNSVAPASLSTPIRKRP
jgi:hypothetical protein